MAFELERKGAGVVDLYVQDPLQAGFNTVKEILHSKVQYVQGSVYDLTKVLAGQLNLVCFLGVI